MFWDIDEGKGWCGSYNTLLSIIELVEVVVAGRVVLSWEVFVEIIPVVSVAMGGVDCIEMFAITGSLGCVAVDEDKEVIPADVEKIDFFFKFSTSFNKLWFSWRIRSKSCCYIAVEFMLCEYI